jgi:hypothetical protein
VGVMTENQFPVCKRDGICGPSGLTHANGLAMSTSEGGTGFGFGLADFTAQSQLSANA